MFKDTEPRCNAAEGEVAFHALGGDDDHFARLDFAHEIGTDDIKRTGFRAERPAVADLAQNQGAHAQGIAHADQFGAGHGDHGKRALDPAQGVFHAFGDGALQGPRHQVDDAFTVRGRLENRAAFNQFAAQGIGVGDVAVMGNRRTAHGEFTKERLHIADRGLAFVAGGGIAHVTDGQFAGQGFHDLLRGEVVAHIAKAAGRLEPVCGVVADDAAGFLSTVLQRVQAKGHKVRCVGDTDNAEYPAFFFQFIAVIGVSQVRGVKRMCRGHDLGQRGAPIPGKKTRTM